MKAFEKTSKKCKKTFLRENPLHLSSEQIEDERTLISILSRPLIFNTCVFARLSVTFKSFDKSFAILKRSDLQNLQVSGASHLAGQ